MALNPRREAFVAAYLRNPNATDAARQAGYAKPEQEGHRLLKNAEIASRVAARVAQVAMSADDVLAELAAVGRLPNAQVLAHKELSSKVRALELIGKYHRLFTEKVEHSGPNGGPLQVIDLSRLSDEELADLERISDKLAAAAGDQGGGG